MNAKDQLVAAMARIDALTLRERAMVLAGLLAMIYFAWDFVLMQPLELRRQAVQNQIQGTNDEIMASNDELEGLDPSRSTEQVKTKKEQLARLNEQVIQLEQDLSGTMNHLVAPGEMTLLLENVLSRTQGLELRKVSGLGATPIDVTASGGTAPATPAGSGAGATRLFRHGLSLEFSGDFFSTLAYLQQLEGLQWNFFWDSIEFKVGEYPNSVSTISVFTLSLNDRWIGE